MWRGDWALFPDFDPTKTNVGEATSAPKGYHTVLSSVKQLPIENKPQKG
jgi:hypothetical protein